MQDYATEYGNELWGTAANDNIDGLNGNDLIYGLDGDDTLIGGVGFDRLYGGLGEDNLLGQTGNDTLYGEAGNDSLAGEIGADYLSGGDGSDVLTGGLDNDRLYGGNNDDTLIGGAGVDFLQGDAGNDVYVFGRGFGQDGINNSNSTNDKDVIRLLAGILPEDIILSRHKNQTPLYTSTHHYFYNYLKIQIKGTSDFILVNEQFKSAQYALDEIQFSDGTIWNTEYIEQAIQEYATEYGNELWGTNSSDSIDGLNGNDIIYGVEGSDTLLGNIGNDKLYGGGDDDHLYGQTEDDSLYGELGQDTLFGGTGNDSLSGGDGDDVLYGGEDADCLYGGNNNDTLIGGAGFDFLQGDAGDDVYVFGRGFGRDVIYNNDSTNSTDTIRFESGIKPEDLQFYKILNYQLVNGYGFNYSLQIRFKNSNDTLYIADYFDPSHSAKYKIDIIEFADGTVWTQDDIALTLASATQGNDTLYINNDNSLDGAAGNDILYGNELDNTLLGNIGEDKLYGGAGNDTLVGGAGFDWLDGQEGKNTYQFSPGDGTDIIFNDNSNGQDIIELGAGVTPENVILTSYSNTTNFTERHSAWRYLQLSFNNSTDKIIVNHYFYQDKYKVGQIKFADGTVWSQADISANIEVNTTPYKANRVLGYDTVPGSELTNIESGTSYGSGHEITAIDNTIKIANINNGGASNGGNYAVKVPNGLADGFEASFVIDWPTSFYDHDWTDTQVMVALAFGVSEPSNLKYNTNSWGYTRPIMHGQPGTGYPTTAFSFKNNPNANNNADVKFWAEDASGTELASGTASSQHRTGIEKVRMQVIPVNGMLQLQLINGQGEVFLSQEMVAPSDNKDAFIVFHYHNYNKTSFTQFRDVSITQLSETPAAGLNSNYSGDNNDEFIIGNVLANTIAGNSGYDTIYGYSGNDVLIGGAGWDSLYGGAGDDTLNGGQDNDVLHGESGHDNYVFAANFGQDTIVNSDTDSINRVTFLSDFNQDDFHLYLTLPKDNKQDLVLQVKGSSDKVTIKNYVIGGEVNSASIKFVEFLNADSEVVSSFNTENLLILARLQTDLMMWSQVQTLMMLCSG